MTKSKRIKSTGQIILGGCSTIRSTAKCCGIIARSRCILADDGGTDTICYSTVADSNSTIRQRLCTITYRRRICTCHLISTFNLSNISSLSAIADSCRTVTYRFSINTGSQGIISCGTAIFIVGIFFWIYGIHAVVMNITATIIYQAYRLFQLRYIDSIGIVGASSYIGNLTRQGFRCLIIFIIFCAAY